MPAFNNVSIKDQIQLIIKKLKVNVTIIDVICFRQKNLVGGGCNPQTPSLLARTTDL
jgi:hypothetical protein